MKIDLIILWECAGIEKSANVSNPLDQTDIHISNISQHYALRQIIGFWKKLGEKAITILIKMICLTTQENTTAYLVEMILYISKDWRCLP
jgi:hypothetical protein